MDAEFPERAARKLLDAIHKAQQNKWHGEFSLTLLFRHGEPKTIRTTEIKNEEVTKT